MNEKIKSKKKIIETIISIVFVIIFIGLITYLVIDLFTPFKELFLNNNRKPLKKALDSYGFLKYLIIAFLHTFQVILSFMPGEPVQLLAGIICGPLFGFCSCLAGIALGNTIIFFAVKFFGRDEGDTTEKVSKYGDIPEKKKGNINSFTWFILGLYFAPAIPYGIIAYTAAKGKMKFLRYIIVTTLGTIPSIFLCLTASTLLLHYSFYIGDLLPAIIVGIFVIITFFLIIKNKKKIARHILNGSVRATIIWLIPLLVITLCMGGFLLAHKHRITLIFFGVFIVYIILYTLLNKPFAKLFTKKEMKDFQSSVVFPKAILFFPLAMILKLFFKIKFKFKTKKIGFKKIEGPAIMLFNHESAYDFAFDAVPIYPQMLNFVTAYYYFCNYHLGRLMHALGCFPKFLYQPDVSSIKNIKRVLNNKGIIALSPEGRLSAYGEMESFIPSTVKLLKKEKVPVYIAKKYGAYFSAPKWAKSTRKGRVDIEYSLLFTAEELEVMTIEEIYNKLYDALYYNEYDWIAKNDVVFKSKTLCEGLENILYICPVCGKEFTYTSNKNSMECSHCHTVVTMDNRYNLISDNKLIPRTIRDWYIYQKEIEYNRIQDPNYILKSNVTLKQPDPKGQGFAIVGKGYTTLTHEGVRYIGTINDEEKDILFKLEHLPALPYGADENFEIYHHNTLYYFIPENKKESVKWSVAEEQMYLDYRKKNNLKDWDA